MEEPKKSKKALIIGIALLFVFAAAYAFVLCSFKNEAENRAVALSPNEKLGNDRLDTSARIVTADPVKGDPLLARRRSDLADTWTRRGQAKVVGRRL